MQLPERDEVPEYSAHRASGVHQRAVLSTAGESSLISICAPADPALLEPTYTYLSAYCCACLPPQLAERMNVAIYELYANALRYGTRDALVRFELRRTPSGGAELI